MINVIVAAFKFNISIETQAHQSTSQHRILQGLITVHSWSFQRPTPESNRGTAGMKNKKAGGLPNLTYSCHALISSFSVYSFINKHIFSFKYSDAKLILGTWKSKQTFAQEIINYLIINNQKEGGTPARIVGAENEKTRERLFELFMEREWCFIRGSWNVHGMFKSFNSH